MTAITAAMVKELRDSTGAGMMDAKKALTEVNGDMDAAVDWLRTKGLAKAAKKADRVAAEGLVGVAVTDGRGVAVEINSETDFVANDINFKNFVDSVAAAALASGAADVDALKSATLPTGQTVEETRATAVQTLGENIQIRRMIKLDTTGNIGAYMNPYLQQVEQAAQCQQQRRCGEGQPMGRPPQACQPPAWRASRLARRQGRVGHGGFQDRCHDGSTVPLAAWLHHPSMGAAWVSRRRIARCAIVRKNDGSPLSDGMDSALVIP